MKSQVPVGQGLQSAGASWLTRGGFLAASLLCLIAASPGTVRAASASVPTVDIATTCRESEKAITNMLGLNSQQTFDRCMKLESDARAEIDRNWLSYTDGGRRSCVNTRVYMPSYVEWLTCLEMEKYVEALRRDNGAGTDAPLTDGRGKR